MSNPKTELLRQQFGQAHQWLEGSMEGLAPAVVNWQPGKTANSIGANYGHLVAGEDALVQGMLAGKAPLIASSYAQSSGLSTPPPQGNWSDWGKSVVVDVAAARAYAQAVYAATDGYLGGLTDDALTQPVDLTAAGLGVVPLSGFLTQLLINVANHHGEISCLKGQQGLQGYVL